MNKQNGLVIRPFKRVHTSGAADQELFWLTQYLTLIGTLDKISHLDHRRWERFLEKQGTPRLG
jgi:ubiquitin-like domain-containing CTD phosphatase 1